MAIATANWQGHFVFVPPPASLSLNLSSIIDHEKTIHRPNRVAIATIYTQTHGPALSNQVFQQWFGKPISNFLVSAYDK